MNFLDFEKVEQIIDCYKRGLSIRETSIIVGAARNTVQAYRNVFLSLEKEEGRTVLCPCGRTAGHRGPCAWRRSRLKNQCTK